MANSKEFWLDEIKQKIVVTKRTSSRSIRLNIKGDRVSVSIPKYLPFLAGLKFARSHQNWIFEKARRENDIEDYVNARLFDGTIIRVRRLQERGSVKREQGEMLVSIPEDKEKAIKYLERCVFNYFKDNVKKRVEPMLDEFSVNFELYPEIVKYKKIHSRWGSCTNQSVLTFSIYLAQVPDEQLRYVVVHELAHLRHLDHSADFWSLVSEMDTNYKSNRKKLKGYPMSIVLE